MSKPGLVVLGSLAAIAGLIALLLWQTRTARPAAAPGQKPLLLFCAAA